MDKGVNCRQSAYSLVYGQIDTDDACIKQQNLYQKFPCILELHIADYRNRIQRRQVMKVIVFKVYEFS
jgi:hypothetical protein